MNPRPRSRTRLFELASQARQGGVELAEGALGADGFGFLVARELETRLVPGGGSKLVNLPGSNDVALALSKVLALTDGWLRVGGHAEELFNCSLFVVTPGGGQDLLSFYVGPSGVALGTGVQLDPARDAVDRAAYERALELPNRLAAALQRALERVPGVDFVWTVGSDFGEHAIGVVGGAPLRGAAPAPLTPWRYPLQHADDWDRARARSTELSRGGAPVEALAELLYVFRVLAPPLAERERATYHRLAAELWPACVAALERALAEVGQGYELPGELDLIGPSVACPPTVELENQLGRDRLRDLWERVAEVHDRRFAAHPIEPAR